MKNGLLQLINDCRIVKLQFQMKFFLFSTHRSCQSSLFPVLRNGMEQTKYFSLLTEGENTAKEVPQMATSKADKSNKKEGTDALYC